MKNWWQLGWLMALWAFAGQGEAQVSGQRRLAVLEFRGPSSMNTSVLGKLSDQARAGALGVVVPKGYLVMTRENLQALLSGMGMGACSEGECEVETARTIGADLVVSGEIVPIKGQLFLTLKLHESSQGNLLATEALEAAGELELVRQVEAATRTLVGKGLENEASLASAGPSLRFGGNIELRTPKVAIAPGGASDLSRINLRIEQLLDAALEAEERSDAVPTQKAAAWCALAEVREDNPYQQQAVDACSQWKQLEASVRALEVQILSDYATLSGYVQLRRITPEQKLAAIGSYLKVYGEFSWHEAVRAVTAARDMIGRGEVAQLPTLKKFFEPKSGLYFVRLEGGISRMGCATTDFQCKDAEKPARMETIGPFSLGITEVTTDAYARCVAAGACTKARDDDATCNWGRRGDHPINCVNWDQAVAFCSWAGGRLPSSAEWEYAAKSGRDVIYPWGNDPVTADRANYGLSQMGTSPVGRHLDGATPWGLLDMGGT